MAWSFKKNPENGSDSRLREYPEAQEAVESQEKQSNDPELAEAKQDYEDCIEKEQETGEQVGQENPEDFDEDEYKDCAGEYVAEITYKNEEPIGTEKLSEIYSDCRDPEDMQEMADKVEDETGAEVIKAEVVERPENPEMVLKGTEEEKQDFVEAHRETEEAIERLEEAAEAAEQNTEIAEEAPEQEQSVAEITEKEENPEESEPADQEENAEEAENPKETEPTEQEAESAEEMSDEEQTPEKTVEEEVKPEETESAEQEAESAEEVPEEEQTSEETVEEEVKLEEVEPAEQEAESAEETPEKEQTSEETAEEEKKPEEAEPAEQETESAEEMPEEEQPSEKTVEEAENPEETESAEQKAESAEEAPEKEQSSEETAEEEKNPEEAESADQEEENAEEILERGQQPEETGEETERDTEDIESVSESKKKVKSEVEESAKSDDSVFLEMDTEIQREKEKLAEKQSKVEQLKQEANEKFQQMPDWGTTKYKQALAEYNVSRDRQDAEEENLKAAEIKLKEMEEQRQNLIREAYAAKDTMPARVTSLEIKGSELDDQFEAQAYGEHPNKEEMQRIVGRNTGFVESLNAAEQDLDAMIAARQSELREYAYSRNFDRWQSTQDAQFCAMQEELKNWKEQKEKISYLRVKAEENTRQLQEMKDTVKEGGLFQKIADKFHHRTESKEEQIEDVSAEEKELRRMGIETVDLKECREEYRSQIVEAVKKVMESNPELRGQVREIRCQKLDSDLTYAEYGPTKIDQPFGGCLRLNSFWFSRKDLEQNLKEESDNGWLAPNANPQSIVEHELGHGMHLELCALHNGIRAGEVPDSDDFRLAVREYIDDRHAEEIVLEACREQKIEFESDKFANVLSNYGAANYGEALAEAVSEVHNNANPRPMARSIYQKLKERRQSLVSQNRNVMDTVLPQAKAASGRDVRKAFLERLQQGSPSQEQQARVAQEWLEKQKRKGQDSTAEDASDEVLRGNGGARDRATERRDEEER